MAASKAKATIKKKAARGGRLFQSFREENPEKVREVGFVVPDVMIEIGCLDTVEYTTRRGGKVEHYRHEFAEKSRPVLAVSDDGKQLMIIGGRYKFTERGITDY